MAISFSRQQSAANSSSSGTSTINAVLSAGATAGNLLVGRIAATANVFGIGGSSLTWNQAFAATTGNAWNWQFFAIAHGGETTFGGFASSSTTPCLIVTLEEWQVFGGVWAPTVGNTLPLDISGSNGTASSATTLSIGPSATTHIPNELILSNIAVQFAAAGTAPTGNAFTSFAMNEGLDGTATSSATAVNVMMFAGNHTFTNTGTLGTTATWTNAGASSELGMASYGAITPIQPGPLVITAPRKHRGVIITPQKIQVFPPPPPQQPIVKTFTRRNRGQVRQVIALPRVAPIPPNQYEPVVVTRTYHRPGFIQLIHSPPGPPQQYPPIVVTPQRKRRFGFLIITTPITESIPPPPTPQHPIVVTTSRHRKGVVTLLRGPTPIFRKPPGLVLVVARPFRRAGRAIILRFTPRIPITQGCVHVTDTPVTTLALTDEAC